MAKLLLVDDDPAVLSVTARLLERVGHFVIPALGGAHGIAAFDRHGPQIQAVLMDVAMPEVDGITAFHQIRRRRAQVPFLFVTGNPELVTAAVLAEPRVALLSKPFQLADLVATVDQALAPVAEPETAWWASPLAQIPPALRLLAPPDTDRTHLGRGQL